jgi:hypothetical protein
LRPHHAKIMFGLLVEAAGMARERQIAAALPRLKRNGYFAAALQSSEPGNLQYQVDILTSLLETVHGDNLDENACREILAGQHRPPTTALLLAVCRLAIPGHAAGILSSFMLGLMRSPELSNELLAVLAARGMREIAEQEPAIVSGKPGRTGSAPQEDVTRGQGARATHEARERLVEAKDQDQQGKGQESQLLRRLLNPGGGVPSRGPRKSPDHDQD